MSRSHGMLFELLESRRHFDAATPGPNDVIKLDSEIVTDAPPIGRWTLGATFDADGRLLALSERSNVQFQRLEDGTYERMTLGFGTPEPFDRADLPARVSLVSETIGPPAQFLYADDQWHRVQGEVALTELPPAMLSAMEAMVTVQPPPAEPAMPVSVDPEASTPGPLELIEFPTNQLIEPHELPEQFTSATYDESGVLLTGYSGNAGYAVVDDGRYLRNEYACIYTSLRTHGLQLRTYDGRTASFTLGYDGQWRLREGDGTIEELPRSMRDAMSARYAQPPVSVEPADIAQEFPGDATVAAAARLTYADRVVLVRTLVDGRTFAYVRDPDGVLRDEVGNQPHHAEGAVAPAEPTAAPDEPSTTPQPTANIDPTPVIATSEPSDPAVNPAPSTALPANPPSDRLPDGPPAGAEVLERVDHDVLV